MDLNKLLRQLGRKMLADWKYTAEEIFVRRNLLAIVMVGVNLLLDYVMITTEGQPGTGGFWLGWIAPNLAFLFMCLLAYEQKRPDGVRILPTIICLNVLAFLLHMALEIRG